MGRKRHSESEVAAKLQQARQLAAQGRSQLEIAKALGVSVMTYHRWRKASRSQRLSAVPEAVAPVETADPASQSRIAELRTENDRLRKLVTDLLLEKVRLEEILNRDGMGNAG
jgi:putative transposase